MKWKNKTNKQTSNKDYGDNNNIDDDDNNNNNSSNNNNNNRPSRWQDVAKSA